MYSTAVSKCRTKHGPQQATQNQPTETQKKTPNLKLLNLEIQSLKK